MTITIPEVPIVLLYLVFVLFAFVVLADLILFVRIKRAKHNKFMSCLEAMKKLSLKTFPKAPVRGSESYRSDIDAWNDSLHEYINLANKLTEKLNEMDDECK